MKKDGSKKRLSHVWSWLAVLLVFAIYSEGAAAISVDAGQMLINLSEAYEPVVRLITATAYTIGVLFVFRALYHLKVYGELRTMMSSQGTGLKQPGALLLTAAMLIFIPTGFEAILNSTFGYEQILDYGVWNGEDDAVNFDVTVAVFKIIQVIGYISFIRGWMLLAKSAQQGSQGGFGKGLTHILAGVFAINIVGTLNMLSSTVAGG